MGRALYPAIGRCLIAALLLCGARGSAQDIITSPAPDKVAVTIYRAEDRSADTAMDLDWLEGYALVTEQRTVSIPAGRATIRFEGVAGGMLPESALVTGLPAGVREKNLDAQLLSPKSLYARSYGRPVILRRLHSGTGKQTEERAIIRSAPDGAVIVQTCEGFEVADCGPLDDSLVYPSVPEGLSARPTLSVETDSPTPARVTVVLSYLAWGFDWQTNYILRMHEGGKRADLTAWVTLASSDPTSFADAEAAVVGGKVNREDERGYDGGQGDEELVFRCNLRGLAVPPPMLAPVPPPPMVAMEAPMADIIVTAQRRSEGAMNVPVTVTAEGLGDLKLYRVPIPTTVAARAQKQVAMLDKPDVAVTIIYKATVYNGDAQPPQLLLRARNRKEDGLGVAMPGGPVAVFEPHGEEQLLVGEGGLADRAVGEEVEVTLAQPTQVTVRSKLLGNGKDYELTVSNANPWPVEFEGDLFIGEEYKLQNVSASLARKNGRPLWKVRVPANGSATLRYRLREVGGN